MITIKGFDGIEITYHGSGVMSVRSLRPLDIERVDVLTEKEDVESYNDYINELLAEMEES